MKDQAAESAVAAIANKVTYGGGATALWGAYTASDIAAVVGAVVAIVGFAVNYYFRRKDNKRNEEYHRARMARLESE